MLYLSECLSVVCSGMLNNTCVSPMWSYLYRNFVKMIWWCTCGCYISCSLKYLNVAMVTVLKNVTNVITAVGEMYIFNKHHDSRVWTALLLMVYARSLNMISLLRFILYILCFRCRLDIGLYVGEIESNRVVSYSSMCIAFCYCSLHLSCMLLLCCS